MLVRAAGTLFLALALTSAPFASARAEPPACSKLPGALAQMTCEAAAALGSEARDALVVAAPLTTELAPRDRERLVSRTASLLAGALGDAARHETRLVSSLSEALALARTVRASKVVYLSVRLLPGRVELSADLHAAAGKFWQRVKNPTPGPRAHAFVARPLDGEVRSYLPPVPLIAKVTERVTGTDADVLALACGDADGDGSSELVVVGRRRISLGRVRAAQFKLEKSVSWGDLGPVAPAPWREPVASATIAGPGVLEVGSTDRADGVRLDGALAKLATLGPSLPWPGTGGCARIEALGLSEQPAACGQATAAPAGADAIAGAEIVLPSGQLQRVQAWRKAAQASVTLVDGQGRQVTLPSAGAELALADLDGDGTVELLSSVDTLEPREDAVLVHSWQADGKLAAKLRVPVPSGVRAIAVCPFEGSGIAPIAIGTAEGLWIVR